MDINTIFIGILLILVIVVTLYQIRMDSHTRSEMFRVQIEMAQGQQAMTKDLGWSDIKKIIDEIINYTVNTYIRTNGINKLSDEDLSLMWVLMLNELCVTVDTSISSEIKRQALKNITESYFTRYIKNSIELMIVYALENNKNNAINNRLSNIQDGTNKKDSPKQQGTKLQK